MVDTKNHLADTLTKVSFRCDECNHLLRLFKIMSFSMSSCSHHSYFLSDPIGKQSTMSKRGQQAPSSEGSPMAKTRPLVPAKARTVNLMLRSPWSARENPPQNLGYPVNLENVKDKVVILVQGDFFGPPKTQKSNVPKGGDRKRNSLFRRKLQSLPVQGNLYRQPLQEQSFKTWSTRTINTWRRSSNAYKSWELQQDAQHCQWKH